MNIIYLLGAGRSGTTLLATVLGNQEGICTLGEMHQFLEHINEGKYCSCGQKFEQCEVWGPVVKDFIKNDINLGEAQPYVEKKEAHKNLPFLLLNNPKDEAYLSIQHAIYTSTRTHIKSAWYVDSSKYISRYLRLKKSDQLRIKGIYLVRDVRGVINSFKKQVQTPKKPLGAILYYLTINFFAELVYRFDKNVLKIRYEDFVENPEETLKKIIGHLTETELATYTLKEEFTMPHIVGGNRMKSQKAIKIKKDTGWQDNISRSKQVWYYMLSAPTMLLNRYKI